MRKEAAHQIEFHQQQWANLGRKILRQKLHSWGVINGKNMEIKFGECSNL
jgi:hypothetical protein